MTLPGKADNKCMCMDTYAKVQWNLLTDTLEGDIIFTVEVCPLLEVNYINIVLLGPHKVSLLERLNVLCP